MKFIMINGCSCSGKSTLVNKIMENKDKYYKLSYDAQKWLFSKYHRDVHFDDVRKVQRALAEVVCEMGYNIVCDSALYRENRELLLSIPKKYGYEVIEINLEADYEVLAKRFDDRVADALARQSKTISNVSKDRWNELYEIYQSEKNPDAMIFRSDTQTADEIADAVLRII